MLAITLYRAQRRAERDRKKQERKRRIEAAVSATVTSVEALCTQARADPGESFPQAEGAVEVHSKGHLRMLVSESEAGLPRADCGSSTGRITRRLQVRGSRR